MDQIKSEVLGTLQANELFDNCWESKPRAVAFFDNEKFIIAYEQFDPTADPTFIQLTRISGQDSWLTMADVYNIADKDDYLLAKFNT